MPSVEANQYLSSGGELPIDAVIPFNLSDDVCDLSGKIWLKSGVVETDLAKYPDATVSDVVPTAINFSAASQETSCMGVTWDGSHFWVVGQVQQKAFKYTALGVYTGTSFSFYSQIPSGVSDIHFDGTYFWILGYSTDTVFKYNSNGSYAGVSFSVSAQDDRPYGITSDDTHLWVTGWINNNVHQYNFDGTYTGVSFYAGNEDGRIDGITWDGSHFWVTGVFTDSVYQYDSAGNYTGKKFSINSGESITFDGTDLWVLSNDVCTKYSVLQHVGFGAEIIDSDSGTPYYVRVK